MRIATIIPLNVNIKNDGEWTTLPNKQRVWQQMIDARVAELRSHGGSAVGGNVATYLYDETMLRCKDILHNYFDVVEITGTLPY